MLQPQFKLNAKKEIYVPGDKSISHRSVLFCALSQGKSEIHGFLEGEDPLHTLHCFESMGLSVSSLGKGSYTVISPGKENLQSPQGVLDFGNAGTGIRLSAGLLSGLPQIQATLTGDASLCKRPMARIMNPLKEMGADIRSVEGNDKAPLFIQGKQLKDYSYKSPIASAQIKSALVLAALSSGISIDYQESEVSRDHTENMIRFLGGNIIHHSPIHFTVKPPYVFEGAKYVIPGDISSAAFFIVFGLCGGGSEPLLIKNIGLNPSRIGIITVLQNMGGKIEIVAKRVECGEEIGDLLIFPSKLKRTVITEDLIPSIIDEIPILTVAGLFSEGGFQISHAEELRAKESDRIHSMVSNLEKLGIHVNEVKDGYEFGEVTSIQKTKIETFMDHRIAMSFAILSKLAGVDLTFDDTSWVDTSFPGFFEILKSM
ncbi:3-phosphoshikimate 1-carboxyvinyltransferase [Leptospira levettii]|uniref:3-phosphoshikimate 1-carboxyvinyltransferase n=1 Tax=Leptospira levettii TaxID=2023178 RepID=UPI0010846004|nr:3-phosphoshikimate 1-carboxyvinyltransferase [Leptospira levettii]MCW7474994.1 3-phosphoshikimate 1-carboxyvinyltransferase [Leptospira levettii]MCW7506519.1 3-phosphoshikimate 1-carboxyvinyltransferase [Leptospira levettii]MCW7517609.1 3-phosphoshikimate 1-carboxyvinyltransferase [Leptospira levettii]TGK93265.1 3-phosphoshikimate 1-carboxyvinyltransferase [Leptospira levettii]TGL09210.1 3-phosphoshikimate 1-carboxyvinyltransferase [Leptospira levettii]